MYDLFANPPWWVVLILSIALAKLWDKLEIGVKAMASYCMTHASGKLKRFLMGRKIKHLQHIKANRFSQLGILRLTIKSYAYLTLFILCALVAVLTAYALQAVIPQHAKILTPALTFIMSTTLLFEVLWLLTSSKVSDLIKYNRKIRKYRPSRETFQSPEKEPMNENPTFYLDRVLEKFSAAAPTNKGVVVKYEPDQKAEVEETNKLLTSLGFKVRHLPNMGALMVSRND